MRKLALLLTTLVFSLTMLASPSFAGWTKVSKTMEGSNFYVDFERIRKYGGYVYYRTLSDYPKSDKYGDLSAVIYNQGDCKLFRYKWLSILFHKEPMGKGKGITGKGSGKWDYPPPDTTIEAILKRVCKDAN